MSQPVSPQQRGNVTAQRELTRGLQQLKQEYVDEDLALHGKARLGANEDSKNKKLLQDIRLGRLAKLAETELLPPRSAGSTSISPATVGAPMSPSL
jgi:hypothetical protein